MILSRRQFLSSAGAMVLTDHFTPMRTTQAEFSFGYDTASWDDQFEPAINEIAELGYRGIQIHSPAYAKYANRSVELKAILAAKKLSLVALAAGAVTLNPTAMKQEVMDYAAKAKWVAESDGQFLQVTDSLRSTAAKPGLDDYRKLGKHLTEIGKRTLGAYGIKLAYRNRLTGLGERREEIDSIMEATDPKYVWLLTDLASLHLAGGDEVRYVRDYLNRLAYPHFNDVRIYQPASSTLDGSKVAAKYDLVELGQGKVNVAGAFQIMKDYRYRGWIVIELSRAIRGRSPKESAAINKRFIEEKLKQKF
jgi:inosose dehydratase